MSAAPNILFIISDQHNAKVMGHRGHADVKTPHLDRLVEEGVRFTNAVTQNPICTPSRLSFLSGQYCLNHGYYGLSGPHPDGLPSVFGQFRGHGYTTAAFGKIHCPEYWVEDDCDYFQETYENCSIGGVSGYSEYLKDKDLFHLRDDATGYDADPMVIPGQQFDGRVSNLGYKDSVEAWIVREAISAMGAAQKARRPFFVQASLPRPHARYVPSEPFWSLYDESSISLPPNADYDMSGKAPHMIQSAAAFRTGNWALFEPKTFEAARMRKLHGYLGCVSQVDHAVGELMQWLEDAGLADDTILIYSSDHGDYACEHGLMEKAPGICADAITRIPYIWRWPGHFAGGKEVTEIVEAVDVANTLCSLTGLPLLETADGPDLSHLLNGGSGEVHEIGVTEFAFSKSVRKGDYRLVYYPPEMFPDEYPDGFGELYNLRQDPWEMRNLFFAPGHQLKVSELRDDLLNWLITKKRPRTSAPHIRFEGPQAIARFRNSVNRDGKIHSDRLLGRPMSYL